MNLGELIRESVERFGEKAFLVERGPYRRKEFTYQEVYERALALCGMFAKAGVKKGDRVLVYLPNGADYVSILWACALSGVIVVPIDFNNKTDFVERIYKIVGARYVFCSVFKAPTKVKRIFSEELGEVYDKFRNYNLKDMIEVSADDIF